MHIIITCLKMFISKRYNKLYDERIYLNLNSKVLEVATRGVLKISTTEAALKLAIFFHRGFVFFYWLIDWININLT